MKYGISSSALFGRMKTDQALAFLRDCGICECVEVFFQCPDEYSGQYRKALFEAARGLNIVSMHMLSSSFEGMLFSASTHGREYALRETADAIRAGHELGAKRYVFHGRNRLMSSKGNTPRLDDPEAVAGALEPVMEILKGYGMTLALENVFWSEFSRPGFGPLIAQRLPGIRFTLDTKQAVRAGFDYHEYMDAMGERLDHVHAYDFDADGKECLPGKGLFDFARFGDELRARGYDGAVIIEAYPYMYRDTDELLEALEYLKRTMGARG